jgi:ABC-type phosphate/phosphonate transport system substrate-binding protein
MAKYSYVPTEDIVIKCEFTVYDLKVLDRVLTEYVDDEGWSYERSLHQDIRQILTQAFQSMHSNTEYDQTRFEKVVEYKIKLKSRKDEVNLSKELDDEIPY